MTTPQHRDRPWVDRAAKEAREERELAPYALKSASTRGRRFTEPADPLRTSWERDRDRIVHCTAFRRLMYKTQVFINRQGDHQRTRLSHSLEVAQVARSVGNALGLNEALCEGLALSHDIGHPPFGHRGEAALDRLMEPFGGFRHNAQVLRVVDLLERRSPDYPGLNLTREFRESLLKHESSRDWPEEFGVKPRHPWLEAQVVDLADSTAYNAHDVEDALSMDLFDESEIHSSVAIWRECAEEVRGKHPGFLEDTLDRNLRIKRVSNQLIKVCINDLMQESRSRITQSGIDAPEQVRELRSLLIGNGPERREQVAELQSFLWKRVYRHPLLQRFSEYADETLSALFAAYRRAPEEMPGWYRRWADRVGLERAVCDYLAGMTDRFAESERDRLAGATSS